MELRRLVLATHNSHKVDELRRILGDQLEGIELLGYDGPEPVEDGDTLTLLQSDYSKVSVRLSDIDAPETSHGRGRPGQPYSQASKQSLLALAGGQQATATCYERDRWERPVCTVFINGQDVNAEQLRRGMAWVSRINRAYVRNPLSAASESQAKAAQLGLWSTQGPRPVPPWEWRRDCWKNKVCDGAGD